MIMMNLVSIKVIQNLRLLLQLILKQIIKFGEEKIKSLKQRVNLIITNLIY